MYKLGFILILIVLLISIIECMQKFKYETPKVDIYAFTKDFDNKKEHKRFIKLEQDKTVSEIVMAFEAFLDEKEKENFPIMNMYAKAHNWTIQNYRYEGFPKYEAILNNGSNIKLFFENNQINNEHEVQIFNLNEKQCNYFLEYYKYNPKIQATVNYYLIEKNIEGISCSMLKSNKGKIIIRLKYNGEVVGKHYSSFIKDIALLFDKKYDEVASEYNNLYFTKESVSSKDFIDGVTYAINPSNNHITIGAIDEIDCQRITHNLPPMIKLKINEDNECTNRLNIIELFQ